MQVQRQKIEDFILKEGCSLDFNVNNFIYIN